ncbi:uncharacterized protein [Watersipora subatra]|uniref:uncharacterized protein n=1 Tax=Watersipora subatra TaxID=2589382 RepID=UPI00355ADEBC
MTGHELDDPSTMTRKPDIGPVEARISDMTFWSRYDAVRNASGPTDHWTKMKIRASERVKSALPASVDHFESSINRSYLNNPGSYHSTRPKTVRQYKDFLQTSYNMRAKEGFQYWLLERPKPTPFGKYGIGSHKTVLGIGNAPRT